MMSNQHDETDCAPAETQPKSKFCCPHLDDRQAAIVAFTAIIAYNAVLTALWLFGLLNW